MQYQSNVSEIKQYLFFGYGCIDDNILYLPFSVNLLNGNGILSEFEYSLN
jgi:hypothetical protein